MSARGYRHTHCRKGHLYTPATTYTYKDGRRECRTCMKERVKRYRQRNRKEIREYQRIWCEGRRRQRGSPTAEANNRWKNRIAPKGDEERLRLPIGPFGAWLRERLDGEEIRAWCRAHGIEERSVRGILNGEWSVTHIDFVDSCLVAAGDPHLLNELYPVAA